MDRKTNSADETAAKLKDAFRDLNLKFQEHETARRAKTAGLEYFDLRRFPIDEGNLVLVPEAEARAAQAVPFYREKQNLKLGFVDQNNPAVAKLVNDLTRKGYQVEPYLVSQTGIDYGLSQYRRVMTVASVRSKEIIIRTNPKALEELQAVGKLPKAPETTVLLAMVMEAAILAGSSDIHLEPEKSLLKIRFRIDGVLQEIADFSLPIYMHLLSRLKLAANLKLNVTNVPQDGRFSVIKDGATTDLRVSVLPSAFGESVVMRLLGTGGVSVEMENLGLAARDFLVF